jgi:hypothetical protein
MYLAAMLLVASYTTPKPLSDLQLSPDRPFACETKQHKPCNIPWERAQKIYWFVTAQISRQVNFEHPPDLRPRVRLILGDDEEIGLSHDITTIKLKDWDERKFALGVGVATATHILTIDKLTDAVKNAMTLLDASVDVKDLKK